MEVIMTKVWDEVFFEEFASFKNLIHKDIETSFPETYSDYAKYFSPNSPFMQDFSWRAFKIMQSGAIVAQAILCWRKGSTVGNLGFIDWKNDQAAAKQLISSVEAAAHASNLKSIKTPVDLTFFLKYRIRLEGGQKPFYGEPIYPAYYHELFKHCGFEVVGKWDTYQLNTLAAIKDFFKKRMMLEKRKDVSQPKARNKNLQTKIRSIKGSDWDNELRIIYQLFNEAYKDMPEYEPVSFEQFKIIYDDFKYIMNPLMSYIVELQGKPVGFSINYVDPLPVLLPLKGKKLSKLEKIKTLARLRLNNSCYIIAHIGKIPGPNGEDIKGVQIQVSKRITIFSLMMRKVLVSYQNIDSPSRRTFNPDVMKLYAQYVVYGKNL